MEAFSATIDEECVDLWVTCFVEIDKLVNHGVNPTTCFYVVKTADDYHELSVEVLVVILNVLEVRRDMYPRATSHHSLRSDFSLILPNVFFSA